MKTLESCARGESGSSLPRIARNMSTCFHISVLAHDRGQIAATVAITSGVGAAHRQISRPAAATSPSLQVADLVLQNGSIITVDAGFTITRAIAIAGDRIIAVGCDAAMTPHRGSGTRVLDLKGKTVVPGLIDDHAHMDREGLKAIFSSLGWVRSIRDILGSDR